jgi:diguanylate cyclase (GGDEF)-like protein
LWTVGFLAAYALLWVWGHIAGVSYAGGNGLSVWYDNAALDVVLFLALGWRWWPLPVLLTAVSILIFPAERGGSLSLNVIAQVPYELILAVAVKITVDVLRVRFPLRSVRDVAIFGGLLCIVAPAFANAVFAAMYSLIDGAGHPWSRFPAQALHGMIADSTAIIVLVPVITQFMGWKAWDRPSPGEDPEAWLGQNLVLGLIATIAIVLGEYAIGVRVGHTLAEFSLVPLAWLAITYGMRGAALGVLVADVTTTLMIVFLRIPVASQIEYRGYLVASALLALILGAIATERQELLGKLRHAAYFDGLTDLPNTGRMLEWILRAGVHPVTLAMIDLADLRLLNEGIGREAADRVLVDVAARLRSVLPTDYFVARVGSGEFAVATARAVEPRAFIAKLQSLLAEAFHIQGSRVFVEAAIGATQSVFTDYAPGELLRRADLALRRAKSSPTKAMVYEGGIERSTTPLLAVELHRAAENGEFEPFFQPIYRRVDGGWRLAGAEMLMRWRHPQRGLLAPSEFIHLLERLSICTSVGWDLLEDSLALAMSWRSIVPDFSVWVNLFPRQMSEPHFVDRIRDTIRSTGGVADALVVEITERIVASNELNVSSIVGSLRSSGVRTAIDDFGIGESSLGRVREVPAEFVKIDRGFVSRSEVDAKAMSVAKTIARLAVELDMRVLAEGIENELQSQAMEAIGCEFGQGYALGFPTPATTFERTLTQSLAS